MAYPADTVGPGTGTTGVHNNGVTGGYGAPVHYDHSPLRKGLYALLTLLSITLAGLTITRIVNTESVPPPGRGSYDKVTAELLASSLLTIPWAIHAIHSLRRRIDTGFGRSFAHELGALLVLWLLWLIGAAVATSHWTDQYSCWYQFSCRLLTAITAIAWSGFAIITFLVIASAILGSKKGGFGKPMHAQYDGRHAGAYDAPITSRNAKHAEMGTTAHV
ncbi:hypothetical protein GGG16DRAFT_99763 [Schizophyllum commune]